jgi:hypothetical protein
MREARLVPQVMIVIATGQACVVAVPAATVAEMG